MFLQYCVQYRLNNAINYFYKYNTKYNSDKIYLTVFKSYSNKNIKLFIKFEDF